jgi:hypothetical protein
MQIFPFPCRCLESDGRRMEKDDKRQKEEQKWGDDHAF